MRTGIVTFHDANNYGAVLQAYALQEALKMLGAEPEFLDFGRKAAAPPPAKPVSPELQARMDKYPRLAAYRSDMAAQRNGMAEQYKKRAKIFQTFREQFLHVSRPYPACERALLGNAYDLFVAGSDQIWNYEIIGLEDQYFLPFVPDKKKLAYAASFGLSTLPEQLHAYYAVHLRSFSALSVREKSGQALVNYLTGRAAPLCLDPVFLPDKTLWDDFAAKGRETGPRIVLYLIDVDRELIALAEKRAKARNLPITLVTANLQTQLGAEHWSGTDVVNFVSQIRQAEEVMTDSFHGLAFSLLFHKNFHIGTRVTRTARYGRLETLLETAGLHDRAGYEEEKPKIDWERVDARLQGEISFSRAFLRDQVGIARFGIIHE